MVKLVAVYSTPPDKAAFDKHYFQNHLPLAKKMPGLLKCEIERPTGSPVPGTDVPHLVAHMYFKDADARLAALNSPEGKAAGKDLMAFAGKSVRMIFCEVIEA